MRHVLSEALHGLVASTRENHEPAFIAQAVAALVDAWSSSALAMIGAAAEAPQGAQKAASGRDPAVASPVQPDAVHASMLASLRLIVDAARAGSTDLDEPCLRFADTFSACLRDAIAGTFLRTTAAFEEQLGLAPGAVN
jgi:hypothetical protein